MEKDYIVVFGGCSIDCTFIQNEDGTYPKIPTKISYGGKGSNQAVSASRAGLNVKMISKLSGDQAEIENTNGILENLKSNEIDTEFIEIESGFSNDVNSIYVTTTGENDIHGRTGAIENFDESMVSKNAEVIKNAKFVIAQMKCPKNVSEKLINFCYENNVPIVITPCRPAKLKIGEDGNRDLLNKITFITANENECKTMFGDLSVEECVSMFPKKLIMTLGGDGAIFHNGEKIVRLPAFKVKNIVDTTGAGDTLNGNFVSAILGGDSLESALMKGMGASTIKIQYKTAQLGMPTKIELYEFLDNYFKIDLHNHTTASDGVYSANEIIDFAKSDTQSIISITDHDSVDAYFEIDKNKLKSSNVKLLPGIEFSFNYNGVSKDMLAYGIDIEKTKKWLSERYSREFSIKKQQDILENFKIQCRNHNVKFDEDLKCETGKKSEAYLKMINSITSYEENKNLDINFETGFYRGYFSNPKTDWYVSETMGLPTISEVVELIHSFGGVAFLAHPFDYRCDETEKLKMIDDAIVAGVDGIEVKHYSNAGTNVQVLKEIVSKNNVYQSGGSDFHGESVKHGVKMFTGKNDNMKVYFTDVCDWLMCQKFYNDN